jgi:beta-fructofuranosidase
MFINRSVTRREFVEVLGVPLLGKIATGPAAPPARTEGDVSADNGHLNYHPRGLYVWDSWYFTHGDEVHVIHLQKKRPGSNRAEQDAVGLGHARSTDLLTWTELPTVLYPGPEGSVDDLDLFTGCTIFNAGTYYLYYTARKRSEQGQIQRLCLATSHDTVHWDKVSEPVIVPDSRWYESGDCRDLMVVQDPETKQFHGFFTARIPSDELVATAVIAHAVSVDLIHWEQRPPVFTPQAFGILEEPDVFQLDGRWWMICATGNFDGVRGKYHDPYVTYGTVYASSNRIEGPYIEGDQNLFMGSIEFNGFSCRTVKWKNKRYVMYTQAERKNNQDRAPATLGCLSTPKETKVLADGRLCPVYSALIETLAHETLIAAGAPPLLEEVSYERAVRRFGTRGNWRATDARIQAASPKSWSVRRCGRKAESFIWKACVRLDEGRAIGLLFRQELAICLDFDQQCVTFTDLPVLDRLESRYMTLQHGRDYHIRIVAKSEFFEAYVDDILLLNFVRYRPQTGQFGLYIEAGHGSFTQLNAVSIQLKSD